ncbi:DUF7718 family protein [Halalkalicoccus paucihalophilus]
MPAGPPRDYDRIHETPLEGPLQIRIGLTTERGRVERFVVQLEYWINDKWREVVRYDHDPESEMGQDVTEEGPFDRAIRAEKHVLGDNWTATVEVAPEREFDYRGNAQP